MYSVKIIKSGKCGDNVSYEFVEDGTLRIFGEGEMWNFEKYIDEVHNIESISSPFNYINSLLSTKNGRLKI